MAEQPVGFNRGRWSGYYTYEVNTLHHQIICPVLHNSSNPCTCYILCKKKKKKKKKTVGQTHDDRPFLSKEKMTVQSCSGTDIHSEAASAALNASKLAAVQNQIACSATVKVDVEDGEEADKEEDEEEQGDEEEAEVEADEEEEMEEEEEEADEEEDKEEDEEEEGGEEEAEKENDEESHNDSGLMDVEGYYVKAEVGPMLRRIYEKHGDIAKDCKIKNRTNIVPMLEMICCFCQKLENTSVYNITMESEIEDMALIVENFQLMGFHVEWLSNRLKDVSKVHLCVKAYLAQKEVNTKIEMKEKEVEILKQKLSTEKAELSTMKVERDRVNCSCIQERNALKVNGYEFWHKSMLNGLI